VADSHLYALRDARARAGTHAVHHPQGKFFSLPVISSPHTPDTPITTGGVASLTRPAQNGYVDLAAIHAHRPAPCRDERAHAGRPVQARDGAPSGSAPGSFKWRAESAKVEPSTVSGIVIFLSRTFLCCCLFFLSTGNNISHFRINATVSTAVDGLKGLYGRMLILSGSITWFCSVSFSWVSVAHNVYENPRMHP
jgi:hypothetical protein